MIDWQGMLERDGPAVWRTAWRILGHRADADECFQETFVAALEYAKDYEVANWRALLLRMATARAIDRLRQRVTRRGHETPLTESHIDHLMTSDPSPPRRVESAELSAQLRAALAHVPAGQGEVFCLFYLEGWSYPEIADHLAISTDVVGVWLHRTRQRLRELLREPNEVSS